MSDSFEKVLAAEKQVLRLKELRTENELSISKLDNPMQQSRGARNIARKAGDAAAEEKANGELTSFEKNIEGLRAQGASIASELWAAETRVCEERAAVPARLCAKHDQLNNRRVAIEEDAAAQLIPLVVALQFVLFKLGLKAVAPPRDGTDLAMKFHHMLNIFPRLSGSDILKMSLASRASLAANFPQVVADAELRYGAFETQRDEIKRIDSEMSEISNLIRTSK